MAKIVEQIIFAQFDLPAFMEQHAGVRMQRIYEGKYKCLCPFPFHKDSVPSFSVDYKNGGWLWNCYGCGQGGNSIGFFQRLYGISYAESVEKICEISGIETDLKSYLSSMSVTTGMDQKKKRFEDLHIEACIKCRNFLRDYPGLKENVKWAKDTFSRMNKLLEIGREEEMEEFLKEINEHTQ